MESQAAYKTLDFYRPLTKPYQVRIAKAMDSKERMERAIRLYCTQYKSSWSLQIRGPMGCTDGTKDIIANASFGRDDLEALRDAINEALNEV